MCIEKTRFGCSSIGSLVRSISISSYDTSVNVCEDTPLGRKRCSSSRRGKPRGTPIIRQLANQEHVVKKRKTPLSPSIDHDSSRKKKGNKKNNAGGIKQCRNRKKGTDTSNQIKRKEKEKRQRQGIDTQSIPCLTTETVEGTALSLQSVDNVQGSDGLALSVLSVCDSIADDTLKEGLQDTTGLLVDH